MSEGTPRSPRWKRWIWRILAFVVLGPWLLLLLGNLALATPWLRGWMGRKISVRCGTEATVGRASCTPWGGVFLGDVTLRQPPALQSALDRPLAEVRGIRVIPRWEGVWKGKLEISEVRIDGPRVVVAVEMLAGLASSAAAKPTVAGPPPALAVAAPSPPAVGEVGAPAVVVPPSDPPAPPAVQPLDPSPVDWPATAWIVITDADFQLRSAAVAGVLGEITGLAARFPVAGKAAPSSMTLARIDVLNRNVATDISLPVAWNPPELRVGPSVVTFAGLQVKVAAVLGRLPGTPFAVEVTVPRQIFDASPFFKQLRPAADQVEARMQGIGLLRLPASWQGVVQAVAAGPVLTVGGEARRFDEARGFAALQGGVFQCPDIRLTGERLSLLGNGQVDGKGQGNAVLRMVVPPEDAAMISQRFTIPGVAGGPVFKPLETPERVFLDLRWISYSGGQGIELGEGGPVVPPGEFGRLVSPATMN
jgi:hypothetical protein